MGDMASLYAASAMMTVSSVSVVSFGERMLAASGSFFITTLVTHPLDVVKTNLQLEGSAKGKGPATGVKQMVSKLLQRDGVGAFYKGIGPSLLMAPGGMVQYAMYDELRKHLSPTPSSLLAAVVDISLKTPFELLKTQMQSNVHRHQSLGQVLMYNVRNGGVISLWAGFTSILARDVPYTALKWVFYDACKLMLRVDESMMMREEGFLALFSGLSARLMRIPI